MNGTAADTRWFASGASWLTETDVFQLPNDDVRSLSERGKTSSVPSPVHPPSCRSPDVRLAKSSREGCYGLAYLELKFWVSCYQLSSQYFRQQSTAIAHHSGWQLKCREYMFSEVMLILMANMRGR